MPDGADLVDRDVNALWDEGNHVVNGGTNWGTDIFDAENYLSVIGPDFESPDDPGTRS